MELVRIYARAQVPGAAPDDPDFAQSTHCLRAMQAIESDPDLEVIDTHSGQVVAASAMATSHPERYAVTELEWYEFAFRHVVTGPTPLSLAVAAKATSDAALIAATWPEPDWARWLNVESLTVEQAAALSTGKEPGQRRALVEAQGLKAVQWVYPAYTFPEGYRRFWALLERFPDRRVTPAELAAFTSTQRWTVPDQISRLAATRAETKEQRQARRYQMCVDAGLTMPTNDYGRLPRGIGALARAEGITRQAFAEDVKAHIRRMSAR